jgi:hypothetical protein
MKKLLFLVVLMLAAPAAPQFTPIAVTGTILVEGGAVVPNFTLMFQHRGGTNLIRVALESDFGNPFKVLSIAESDKIFSVTLPEGDCLVSVPLMDLPVNYYVKSISAGSVDLRRSPLTVIRSAIPRIVVILGVTKHAQGSKVYGRVTGLPPEVLSAQPPVVLQDHGELLSTRIDADGFFEFAHVPAGKYTARVARTLGVQPSPSTPVVVTDKDVSGVLIPMPPVTYVRGRVTVEGTGLLPFLDFSASGAFGSVQGTVTVMPDGTFKLILPKGGCDIALNTATLPVGYSLRFLKYGSTDLLNTPSIQILSANAEELHAVVAVTNVAVTVATSGIIAKPAGSNAWVSVKGRVRGLIPDDSRFQVFIHSAQRLVCAIGVRGYSMLGETNLSDTETMVNPDGSFEFPKVTQGKYVLSVTPAITIGSFFMGEFPKAAQDSYVLSTMPASFAVYRLVEVTDEDIHGIEMFIPTLKIVTGRIYVESGGRMPRSYGFTLSGAVANVIVTIKPSCNGSFLAMLPEGEYRMSTRLPAGYVNKFAYGSADLLNQNLKVSKKDHDELRIVLAANTTPGIDVVGGESYGPLFSGLDNGPPWPQRGDGLAGGIVHGCVAIASETNSEVPAFSLKFTGASSSEVPVMSDGTFNISLPKGEYHVTPGELPRGYTLKSILADSTDLRRETLKLYDVPPFIMIVLDAP